MKTCHVLWIWIFLSGFRDSATDGTKLHGYSGKRIIISCSHEWASNNIKYFCRDPCKDGDILVKSDRSPKGRYTLKDSGTGTFTVNITDLQESDSGIYWCGVQRTGLDKYTKVHLTVSEDPNENITTSTQPHKDIHTSTGLHTTTPTALSESPSTTASPEALTLSPSATASSNTTVYILYAVGGLVIAVIILVVGLIAVHQCRKKVTTSASTGRVTPVNKLNESRDEMGDAKDYDESVYENDTPNTDKSTPMKPINRPEVPKRQAHAVYGNVQLSVGQSHELYGNL